MNVSTTTSDTGRLTDSAVAASVPDDVRNYRRKVTRRVREPLVFSVVGILGMWVLSVSSMSPKYPFPSISGSAMLAGFGILATLVVAVQVLARSLRTRDKRRGPGPVEFLGWLCWIILLADTGLATLVVFRSFFLISDPDNRQVQMLVGLTALVLGTLIALIASDAAEHAKLLETQTAACRVQEIREAEQLVRAFPERGPSPRQRVIQWLVLFPGCPALCSLAGGIWFGLNAAIAGGLGSVVLGLLAYRRARKLCVLWYSKKTWSLVGTVFEGVFFWVIFGLILISAVLQAAPRGSLGHDEMTKATQLMRFLAFYIVVTALPLYTAGWLCRTYDSCRGIILDSAARQQSRVLLKLTSPAAQPRPHFRTWMERNGFRYLRTKLHLIVFAILGAIFATAVIWLVTFGPETVMPLFN